MDPKSVTVGLSYRTDTPPLTLAESPIPTVLVWPAAHLSPQRQINGHPIGGPTVGLAGQDRVRRPGRAQGESPWGKAGRHNMFHRRGQLFDAQRAEEVPDRDVLRNLSDTREALCPGG